MESDVKTILSRIKKNIKAAEAHGLSNTVADCIEEDFRDLFEFIKLFLISERDSYYGYFLMNMKWRTNFKADCIAGIKLNEFPPVLESNPLILGKFTLKEILFIICHEIDHVVFNHPAEMVKANPEHDPEIYQLFNLAADAAVNDRINYEIEKENHRFMTPPEGVITSSVLGKMFHIKNIAPMESYEYYFELVKPYANKQKSPQFVNGQQEIWQKKLAKEDSFDTDGATGNNESTGNGKFGDTENPNSQGISNAPFRGPLNDHHWETENDMEDAAASVRELVNAAFDMMNEETRGLMPGGFMSQIQKLNAPPKICWQAILKKYIGTVVANKRKTKTRLNRRQPERFDLSGSMDDKILKIVVAIDTSGSVDDSMISAIMNEIFSIIAKRKHDITVIECDSEVQRVYTAKTAADIKMKVKGRGGTWFSPVIEYVNKDKYFRDALLIYFTDGYGEDEIPKPKTYRNMWVVFDDERNLSLKEPYGVVLSLK